MPVSPGGTYYDEEELDSLYRAIGFVVIQWGQAEQTLELIVAMLYQSLGGKSLTKKIPILLTAKLDFLKTCLSRLPPLTQFKTEGETLAGNFTRLGKQRHDLIHGAIASLSSEDGAFRFAKLDVKNGFHVARTVRFEAKAFPGLTKDLIDLGNASVELASKLKALC